MAKKILALVMAIALVVCFAVSASAEVITTTKYIAGEPAEAEVSVTVTDVTAGTNVTYYAKNANDDVYVNQEKATGTSVTFNYITAYANVESDVIVGYTNVEDAYEGTIPVAPMYTIYYGDVKAGEVYTTVTETTVSITPVIPEFHSVTAISATNATTSKEVCTDNGDGTWSVVLSNITGNVTITVDTEEIEIPGYTETLEIADAAAIVVKEAGNDEVEENLGDNEPDVNAAVGNRKLTVCGKAGAFDEYGIIVSETAITAGSYRAIDALGDAYEAMDKDDDNKFAVQIIDTSDDGAIINAANSYYTAVYGYSAANQAYYVEVLADAVKAN